MAQTLGQLLRKARADAGLTLRDVENLTGISNGYLSQMESDSIRQPSPNHLHSLAVALREEYASLMKAAGYAVAREIRAVPKRVPTQKLFSGTDDLTAEDRAKIQAYIDDLRDARSVRSRSG